MAKNYLNENNYTDLMKVNYSNLDFKIIKIMLFGWQGQKCK